MRIPPIENKGLRKNHGEKHFYIWRNTMSQHYSFRVPWHDNGWNGAICSNPSENYACMRLKGINQGRDEEMENSCASCRFCDLDCVNDMPCIKEQ